jgi:YD repeat-containing protein
MSPHLCKGRKDGPATGITFLPTYSAPTNRFASVPGGTPTYDNNGNLTNDLTNTYASDTDGDVIRVDAIALTYDALDRLVEQNSSGSYTQVVYGPNGSKLALMNTTTTLVKGFLPLGAGPAFRVID